MAYGMQPQRDPTEVIGRRIAAYLIDLVLISGVLVAVLAATKDQAFMGAPAQACRTLRASGDFSGQCLQFGSRVYTWKSGGLLKGYGVGALAGFLDLVVLQGITGASIGKLILGVRVVNAQGQSCGVGRAFIRWLLLLTVDGWCFVVGLLVALLTHPHRRVGDMAAGTYVVALADVGRPVQAGVPAPYPPGYPPGGPAGWAPPGTQPTPGWGAPPAPPAWGGPAAPPPPSWGAPPPPPPPWGAPPPAATPPWGTTPPAAAPDPQQPAPWGGPVPTPPPPAPAPAPTPPPPPPPPPAADPAAPAAPDTPVEGESWWSRAVSDDDEPEK
jgi:uncharacterized RDD family membrane protein YckC